MSLVVDDPDFQLWQGDAIEMLRGLPSGSVHCALTSPPFYGLRDYGTGSWEGGGEGCDHIRDSRSYSEGCKGCSVPLDVITEGCANCAARERMAKKRGNTLKAYRTPEEAWADIPNPPAGWQGSSRHAVPDVYGDVCGKCGAHRVDNQIGLEATPDEWVARLVEVFREVRRVLRDDGTLWVEIGDSYVSQGGSREGYESNTGQGKRRQAEPQGRGLGGGSVSSDVAAPGYLRAPGIAPKNLVGAPWLLAFALRADGWYLRSEIIWDRPNPMPESVTDRPTKSHSTVFLLAKQPRYFFDQEAVREPHLTADRKGERVSYPPGSASSYHMDDGHRKGNHGHPGLPIQAAGRNVRSVWRIATQPTPFAHFATWPEKLVERIILAGTSERGCCPECGAPWERETATSYDAQGRTTNGPRSTERRHESPGREVRMVKDVTTTGWRPSCAHDLDPVPCTVLDPFMGSGTTALVARRLGRRSVGVELSPSYSRLCAERLSQQSLFA